MRQNLCYSLVECGNFYSLTLHKHCRCTPEFRASDYILLLQHATAGAN